MDSNIKNMAYAGFIAKGTVYALTGILAFLTAFDLGGQKAGKLQVLEFLEKQPFGKFLLAILGIGLLCYASWRFVQSFKDPENIGSDNKGIAKRVSFFISGIIYLSLGIYAIAEVFKNGSSGSGSSIPFEGKTAQYLFITIGIGLAIKSIYQFIKAYKGEFLDKFKLSLGEKKQTVFKNIAYAGLIARGIVVGIIAYFFITASSGAGSESVKGTKEAFSFIQQNSSGPWLLGLVAIGLVCYGVYMLAHPKYRTFSS